MIFISTNMPIRAANSSDSVRLCWRKEFWKCYLITRTQQRRQQFHLTKMVLLREHN